MTEMISQADIIRTLVNKNCTDESIMSIVLSPGCTPSKLLEKFSEQERFDLALDLSMKLGLDVSPIWRTWAMRCLKNRNFQGAREKFRHYFQRVRVPVGRANAAGSKLICDILDELIPMSETKMPLSEEIDLIKTRKNHLQAYVDLGGGSLSFREPGAMQSKPKILAECLHYLKEYGTIEDRIKFHIRTRMWQEAVKLLLESRSKINADRFFIVEVVLRTSTEGSFDKILAAFMEQDPEIKRAYKYYKAIYNYYTAHERFNSLYYLQNKIGDHVAAAENQIKNFFLKKPIHSYKELNYRIARLVDASANYRQHIVHLEKLESGKFDEKAVDSCSLLFTNATFKEAEDRCKLIETQIEITRNFAINEVHGCINNIDVVCGGSSNSEKPTVEDDAVDDNMTPVTLFDTTERRKNFLAALVMIYFDLDCAAYFSPSGLKMAIRLIQDYRLDKISVFKTAMRTIIEDESCDIEANANLLLQRVTEDHLATSCSVKSTIPTKTRRSFKQVIIREVAHIAEIDSANTNNLETPPSSQSLVSSKSPASSSNEGARPKSRPVKQGTKEYARIICDDIIRDAIMSCCEPDYQMKLTNLLSPEAKIKHYIELGKLSTAQRLAFDMNSRDNVLIVMREAEKLNQDHIKDVCQHWLAKH